MEQKDIKRIIIWTLAISVVPVIIYLLKFGSWTLSDNLSDWNSFSGYLSGFIGPFISFLALLVTVYIAYSLKEYEKRKDKQLKEQDDVKSYLELYQYFTGLEFREKRQVGWNVARKGIENKEYADFIVKEAFVCRYSDRTSRTEVFNKYKALYQEEMTDKKKFLHKESEDRHKLDAVVNFFQLLAIKDVPTENYKVCDFYYDSWRPILCWYAKKLEEGYAKYDINKQFSNPPNLRASIALLDKKYYSPEIADTLTVDTISEHPILKWYVSKQSDE
jgi:hypothetical protein